MTNVCLSGCVVRGRHGSDCVGQGCEGCLPRPASVGTLCGWCWQRLNGAVTDVPQATGHLMSVAHSPLPASTMKSGSSKIPGPGSLWSPALDAGDALAACLGSWADLIVAEHPAGLRGPSRLGWRFSRPPARAVDGQVVIDEEQRLGASQAAVEYLAHWIRPHLDWVADQEWACEMKQELCSSLGRIWARWPIKERSRWSTVACPVCGGPLAYDPPSAFGTPALTRCVSEECARIWNDSEWARFVDDVARR